jgi:ankyrin repeat protein
VVSLKNVICDRDSGIFQWVTLITASVVEMYLAGMRLTKIQEAIQAKPTQLYDLYRSFVESLEEEQRPKLLRIVQWVMFSQEALTLGQLRHVLAASSGSSTSLTACLQDTDCETETELERQMRDLSRGLLEVIHIRSPSSSGVEKIQFIHQSVPDYISDEGFRALSSTFTTPTDFVAKSQNRLSRTCLRYIEMDEVRQGTMQLTYKDLILLPLLRYAVGYWLEHALVAEAHGIGQEDLLAVFDWPKCSLLTVWVTLCKTLFYAGSNLNRRVRCGMDLLHLACQHGLPSVVRACLDRIDKRTVDFSADYNAQCGRTPLSFAAESGQREIVQTLVRRSDVDINARSATTGKSTPILYATSQGHEAIALDLLDQEGININLRSKGRGVLGFALLQCQQSLVKALMNRDDVDINVMHKRKSLLSLAVAGNDQESVKLLLRRKEVDVNIVNQRGLGSTPIFVAVQHGNEAMVKLLLGHPNIQLDKRNKAGQTVLEVAMVLVIGRWTLEEIGVMLGEASPYSYQDTLYQADWNGAYEMFVKRCAIVKLLEEHGATLREGTFIPVPFPGWGHRHLPGVFFSSRSRTEGSAERNADPFGSAIARTRSGFPASLSHQLRIALIFISLTGSAGVEFDPFVSSRCKNSHFWERNDYGHLGGSG